MIFVILSRDGVNIYMQSSKLSFSRSVINLAPACCSCLVDVGLMRSTNGSSTRRNHCAYVMRDLCYRLIYAYGIEAATFSAEHGLHGTALHVAACFEHG